MELEQADKFQTEERYGASVYIYNNRYRPLEESGATPLNSILTFLLFDQGGELEMPEHDRLSHKVEERLQNAINRAEAPDSLYLSKSITCLFWFAVKQTLKASYRVYGKNPEILQPRSYRLCYGTLFAVRAILRIKNTDNPLLHLVEIMYGGGEDSYEEMMHRREEDSYDMPYINHYLGAFLKWFLEKHSLPKNANSKTTLVYTGALDVEDITIPGLKPFTIYEKKYYWMITDLLNSLLLIAHKYLSSKKIAIPEPPSKANDVKIVHKMVAIDEIIEPLEKEGFEEEELMVIQD